MPRTNPNDLSPNPCKRWFLWDGSKGDLKYYDKETQEDVHVPLPFSFILLDRLATIRGWHDSSESGIYSNEVRNTTQEPFVVRAYKMKEPIAQGFYAEVKDRVKASGGKFNSNLYIAFQPDKQFAIGSLMLHGASLGAWMEFEKANRKELFTKGIQIGSFEEGKKGGITFRKPCLELFDLTPDVDDGAGELQKEMQAFLTKYLVRESKTSDSHVDTSEEYNQATPKPDDEEEEVPF
jgi:hypothetical protein